MDIILSLLLLSSSHKGTHFKFSDIRKDRIVYCPQSDAEEVTKASAHEFPVEDLDFPAFTIRTVTKMFHGSDECFWIQL